MEEKNKNVCGMDCACNSKAGYGCNSCCDSGCGHGCGHGKHKFWRRIIWVVIALIIFCFGIEWGEMKTEARGAYYFNKMMGNYDNDFNRFEMMKNFKQDIKPATETPSATTP